MESKSKLNVVVFKRLLSYWKTYKRLFVIAVLCTILLAFIGPARPLIIGQMVSKYIAKGQDANMLLIWTLIIGGALILEALFQFLASYFANLFAQSIIRDLRKKLVGKILTFRMQFFDKTPIGALVTRVVSDLEAITEVFSSGLMNIAGDLLSVFVVIVAMFVLDWQLAILTLTPIPILIFATRIFARVIRGTLKQEQKAVTALNTFVQERLTGVSLVQLFNREDKEFQSFKKINKNHLKAHINAVWAYSIFFPIVELLSSLSIALMLVWCAFSMKGASTEEISNRFGQVVTFTLWVYMLYRPIRQLADKFNILQRGTVRAERVFEILDREDQIQNDGEIVDCDFNKTIKFDSVSFAYTDEDWVLKDISLDIEPGSTVAFVGATGAGKSTIVNLLGRFYEFQKGEIRLGAIDLKSLELHYLRKNISIVLQDVFLFSDSILNNITLSDPNISKEQVIEAAKAVGVHEFINQLPEGYETQVGERGGVLSVGQRQLLAFIRAYVYNPHILILDEATSSVDNELEELIQNATNKLTKGRTSIVIAHRLSTIQSADKIVVLEKGEIVENGTHKELMQLGGYYKTLHEMQFSED
ncbi:MAG: ABC transporter ATP-binding protein/permease [Crocinitomicaceae bacterium]|nr:ABC transporter ATP-binding protein/permease [Crocinitomicaceae bacterium]